MDYAVIKTGAKQYKVKEGDTILVEKLPGETGEKVSFDTVLLTSKSGKVEVGMPTIEKQIVEGKLIEQGRAKKVSVIRYKSKSRYFKRTGHRQPFTKVEITKI